MREPHVRFCERHGGAILRAYSTSSPVAAKRGVADAGLEVGLPSRDHGNGRPLPGLIDPDRRDWRGRLYIRSGDPRGAVR